MLRTTGRAAAVMVLLVTSTLTLPAQLPGRTGQVRAVVDSFFSAAERQQWDAAAALMDTAAFGTYVRTQVRNARSAIPQRPMTVEDLMARDTTMPRAVAEWQLQLMQKASPSPMTGPFAFLSAEFLGVTSPQQLSELTTMQAMARWVAARDPRERLRESSRQFGCPDSVLRAIPMEKSVIHGVAFDGDTTAYVVVMNANRFPSAGLLGPGNERLIVLHSRGTTWRIEPRRELFTPEGIMFSAVVCDRK